MLLKSNIDQDEYCILGLSIVTLAKKIKELIKKYKLTIADLEGAGLEMLKRQYENYVELEYHVDQLKSAVLEEAQWSDGDNDLSRPMDLESTQNNALAKLPLLKQEDGNSFKPIQNKNDLKARSILMMILPSEHLLTFNQYKDAKTLFEAIEARFGGNEATKKTQKTLLKQMYENFNASSSESLDSIFTWLQKIVSQLAILDENISQEDLNFKFLRSLPSEWSMHVVVWRNKPDLGSISFDDLYNNFKIVEQEVVHEDLEQIHEDDLKEIDLKWQLALLSMKARKFYQRTRKKIIINGSDTAGYDKTKVECFNCHKMGHFARVCRNPRSQENRSRNQDSSRRTVNVEKTSSKAMLAIDGIQRIELNKSEFDLANYKKGLASVEEQLVFMLCDQIVVLKRDASFNESKINALKIQIERLKKEKESNQIKIDNFENASKSLDKLIGSQISDNNRKEWVSDNEDEVESPVVVEKKTVVPTIPKVDVVRPKQQEKPIRKTVRYVEMYISKGHRGNQRN
ncbi:ribonuclease H-like domain-containing protein [Tanacetum coccineum]